MQFSPSSSSQLSSSSSSSSSSLSSIRATSATTKTCYKNIESCIALSNVMKSILGPKSFDKLLIDAEGDLFTTNDGATAISTMNVSHPAAKLLIQLSRAMDDEIGDGTTSVVILSGSLLQQALYLLKQNIHPMMIIRGYQRALVIAEEYLRNYPSRRISVKELFENKENTNLLGFLLDITRTSLNSKIASHLLPQLSSIAVNAMLLTKGKEKNIQVILDETSSIQQSVLLDGNCYCMEKVSFSVINTSGRRLQNVNIAMLAFPLDKPRVLGHDYKVVITDSAQIDKLIKEEENYIRSIVLNLKKAGIQLVCVLESLIGSGSRQVLSDLAISWLRKAKIAALKPVKKEKFEKLCFITGAKPMTGSEQLLEKDFLISRSGKVKSIHEMNIGSHQYMMIQCELDDKNKSSTFGHACIVLRGPSLTVVEELERALHDALRVLERLFSSQHIVPGGGSCEIGISTFIQKMISEVLPNQNQGERLQTSVSPIETLVMRAFCNAMEDIPRILSSNAGLNPVETVDALRQIHLSENKNKTSFGVYCGDKESGITDMTLKGIFEILDGKIAQITMATQASIQILKIDDIFSI